MSTEARCFVVLPCYNEEQNIKPLISCIDEVLKPVIRYRIIAVNDGSRDRTEEILKDVSFDYPVEVYRHRTNLGLGAALRTGLVAAVRQSFEDDFVVTMDCDNTHNPKHVLDMLNAARNADIIVGSRYVKGGRQLNVPAHRVILSRAINFLVKAMLNSPLRDNTSGYRCFKARLLKRVYRVFGGRIIESSGFVCSLELFMKSLRSGGRAVEIPIVLDYAKKGGASKMRLFSTVLGYLRLLLFRYDR